MRSPRAPVAWGRLFLYDGLHGVFVDLLMIGAGRERESADAGIVVGVARIALARGQRVIGAQLALNLENSIRCPSAGSRRLG